MDSKNKRAEISPDEFYEQSNELIKGFFNVSTEGDYHMGSICYALSWSLACAAQHVGLTKEQAAEDFMEIFEDVLKQESGAQQ